MQNTIAVILAAGKGKRLGSFYGNKVLILLRNKPLIKYAVEIFEKIAVPIFMVVGYGKTKVKKVINDRAFFVEQKEQMGTGHAVSCVMPVINKKVLDIFVVMGDHAFAIKSGYLIKLHKLHKQTDAEVTLLTINTRRFKGYGRILRDKRGKIYEIVDGKHSMFASETEAEITPGIYLFKTEFLQQLLPKLEKDNISQEYYLSDIINLAYKNHKKISAINIDDQKLAIGINTADDLKTMEVLWRNTK